MGNLADPANHLQWLGMTLREIEANREIAILIGHVPPGSFACVNEWSRRFKAITDRF